MRLFAWMTGGWMALSGGNCGSDGTSEPAPVDTDQTDTDVPDPPMDTDQPTSAGFCGDGVCAVDEEEGCTSCPDDCDTQAAVCGNGACDAGEGGACEADCGPELWPDAWLVDALDTLDAINAVRAVGGGCPSGVVYDPQPALVWDPVAAEAARLHSWDLAYSDYFDHFSCNGRDPLDRLFDVGGTGFAGENLAGGYSSPATVVEGWRTSTTGHCDLLYAGATGAGVGVADVDGWPLWSLTLTW